MSEQFRWLIARYSLSFLWLFTAVTSLFFAEQFGFKLLATAGVEGLWADLAVYGGSAVDAALGLWLLLGWRLSLCYRLQWLVIVLYSGLLTLIDASYWLHPFGPLTKNIPIVALMLLLQGRDR